MPTSEACTVKSHVIPGDNVYSVIAVHAHSHNWWLYTLSIILQFGLQCTKAYKVYRHKSSLSVSSTVCPQFYPCLRIVYALSSPLIQEATIGSVVREMGWWQLATRGLGLRIVMIGTLTATQWAIYDSFKVYVGL